LVLTFYLANREVNPRSDPRNPRVGTDATSDGETLLTWPFFLRNLPRL